MNTVSPVRVRVENHVKTRMMATNFQDFLERNNRKKVKIGSSTVMRRSRAAGRRASSTKRLCGDGDSLVKKSKSLSPKPRWCPPPARTTKSSTNSSLATKPTSTQTELNRICRLTDYDELIPVKESSNISKQLLDDQPDIVSSSAVRSCSVCKPHSRSPSPQQRQLPLSAATLNGSTRSIDNSYLSPTLSSQLRATFPSAQRRSRSWDQPSARSATAPLENNNDFIAPKREYLVEKLVETKSIANEIAKHLAYVKDYLSLEVNDLVVNSGYVIQQFENDRNRLLDMIDAFEEANEDLKEVIYDLSSPKTMEFFRQQQENQFLKSHIDSLEMENKGYKKMLSELEKNVNKSGTANEALNIENNVLTNIRMCLEDNRAHLSRQLNMKESEVHRLKAKMRELNRKLDRAQIENELLRENRQKMGLDPLKMASSSSSTTLGNKPSRSSLNRPESQTKGIKLVKKYYNLEEILADPVKIRLYVEKLNRQLKEKDGIINNLNEILIAKEGNESNQITQKPRNETSSVVESLRDENERLKKIAENKGDKLKMAEIKLKLLQKQASQKRDSDDPSSSSSTRKKFSETELDKVRARLEQRINELEPLPELLRSSELKLNDALAKIASYELDLNEYRRQVDELRGQLLQHRKNNNNNNKSFVDKSAATSARLVEQQQPLTSAEMLAGGNNSRQLPIIENLTINQPAQPNLDRLMLSVEEENRELLRQLAAKDEIIRELTGKLSSKTNEAISYSRQLDMALNDAKVKEQQLREKFNFKERTLQLRCNELEAKLASLDFHSNVDRKDKDNMAHEYLYQIRDLKTKLEQALVTNKQMQEYVNFIKNSYVTYFNDPPVGSLDVGNANNFIGLSQNNIL